MIIEEASWNELAEYREALEQSGVKNMRWYRHIFGKYQDHAKYAAGRSSPDKKTSKRADDDAKAKAKAEKKAADAKAKAEKKEADAKAKAEKKEADAKAKAEKEAAEKEKERQKILSDPKKLYKHRKEYSYDEIKKAVDRFKQESELQKYAKETMQKGADYINLVNTYATSAINVYNTAARIINTINDNGKYNSVPFIDGLKADRNKSRVKSQQNKRE